jgi:hypothetical protein
MLIDNNSKILDDVKLRSMVSAQDYRAIMDAISLHGSAGLTIAQKEILYSNGVIINSKEIAFNIAPIIQHEPPIAVNPQTTITTVANKSYATIAEQPVATSIAIQPVTISTNPVGTETKPIEQTQPAVVPEPITSMANPVNIIKKVTVFDGLTNYIYKLLYKQ